MRAVAGKLICSAITWPRSLFTSADAAGATVDIHTSSCTPLVQLSSDPSVTNRSGPASNSLPTFGLPICHSSIFFIYVIFRQSLCSDFRFQEGSGFAHALPTQPSIHCFWRVEKQNIVVIDPTSLHTPPPPVVVGWLVHFARHQDDELHKVRSDSVAHAQDRTGHDGRVAVGSAHGGGEI